MRLVGLGIQAEEVDGARATWSRAHVRHLLTEQGIDQAGFADIRPPQESEFRRTFRRKEFWVGSGSEELCNDGLHAVTISLAKSERLPKFREDICHRFALMSADERKVTERAGALEPK